MKNFVDPELAPEEGSEIAAAVDVSVRGEDGTFRPIYINQDKDFLQITLEDAKRLHGFLSSAIEFVEEYSTSTRQ